MELPMPAGVPVRSIAEVVEVVDSPEREWWCRSIGQIGRRKSGETKSVCRGLGRKELHQRHRQGIILVAKEHSEVTTPFLQVTIVL
jgi:hypothetical protein